MAYESLSPTEQSNSRYVWFYSTLDQNVARILVLDQWLSDVMQSQSNIGIIFDIQAVDTFRAVNFTEKSPRRIHCHFQNLVSLLVVKIRWLGNMNASFL